MLLVNALFALGTSSAPPVEVPDARAAVAVWCAPTCTPVAVDALRAVLDDSFKLRPWLPRRTASEARATVRVMPADGFGRWSEDALDLAGETLTAEDRARLAGSAEVVVVSTAVPRGGGALKRLRVLYAAALELARSQGGYVEDIDTREVYTPLAWEALRVQALEGAPLLPELFTVVWSEDGTQATTLGLRRLGLHELSLGGLGPELAADALATLTLFAALEQAGTPVNRELVASLDALPEGPTRDWLSAWRVDPGEEGAGASALPGVTVSVRNRRPRPGDPPGPILELGANGHFGDPERTAALMDQLWGWTTLSAP